VGKRPVKLKSYDDDHPEHSRGGGDWSGMSMQRNGEYCMHKMHRSYIYTVQRREALLLLLEVAMIVVGEVDSCVKKEESAATEIHRRGKVALRVERTCPEVLDSSTSFHTSSLIIDQQ
jgi:hypothetical protein